MTGSKKNGRAGTIAAILLLVLGVGILLYPTFSDWWNRRRNAGLINEYEAVLQDLSREDYNTLWEEARAYNALHTSNTFTDVFEGEEEYILRHPYDQMLDPTGSHMMGYIEIPKIAQRLAIGHGIGTETLERGVGHVEGSSLPTGDIGTHAVLAGHRGLPRAKIFTDLDQITTGDKFFLYILDEIFAYEVDQITIVEPDDDKDLQIDANENLVTLLTCTPYGVNSHRLLVRGHRVPYDPGDIEEQAGQWQLPDRERPIVIMIIALLGLLGVVLIRRGLGKRKEKKQRDIDALHDKQE